jgi:hypothetical protein
VRQAARPSPRSDRHRGAARADTYALEGTARLEPGGLALTLSQTTLQLPPGRVLGEAPLRATVAIKGADVAGLVMPFVATPALRGPVQGTLHVAGTISHPTAQGELALSGLTVSERRPSCPPPPDRQLQLATCGCLWRSRWPAWTPRRCRTRGGRNGCGSRGGQSHAGR